MGVLLKMTSNEAYNRLISEGCNPLNIFIGDRGGANDAIGLSREGNLWKVYYTERGVDSDPMFLSEYENEAAEYFYKENTSSPHLHLVGSFEDEANALALEAELSIVGIMPVRNDIPSFDFIGDSRYRVFVSGVDIFSVRDTIGSEIKTDSNPN